jgi:death-on-curing protein
MEPIFLTLDDVLEIHEQQIELYGGSHGLRDPGALESAVATPQATFGGEYLHGSLYLMAAAYLFHITHRTARSSTAINGLELTRPSRSC